MRARAALVVTALAALACGNGTFVASGTPHGVRLVPGDCGAWKAEVDYAGSGVHVLLDGREVQELPASTGLSTYAFDGEAHPGELIRVTARGPDGLAVEQTLTIPRYRPPIDVSLKRGFNPAKRLRAGTSAELHVAGVLGGCDMDGWTWTATFPDGTKHGPEKLEFMGTDVAVPGTKELGPQVVKLDFVGADGATWTEELRYDVVASTDADRDGHEHVDAGGDDCDDDDRGVFPTAVEREDGKDQDCNGLVDDQTRAYDDDGDGVSENAGDCDDADATRAPHLAESPDCRDEDCDGEIDDGITRPTMDDVLEPNDTRETAWDMGADAKADLRIVSRDEKDEEWFRLSTKDYHLVDEPLRAMGSIIAGSLDGWRLKVVPHQMPDEAAYRVEFWHDGAKMGAGTLSSTSGKVRMDGSILRDDSGEWLVRVVPVRLPGEYCPASFRIRGD